MMAIAFPASILLPTRWGSETTSKLVIPSRAACLGASSNAPAPIMIIEGILIWTDSVII